MTDFYYLPVEIKHREFLGKMLLASHLLELGCPVLIGKRVSSDHPALGGVNACVLTKSAAAVDNPIIANYLLKQHRVYSLDEEGLLMASLNVFVRKRFTHENVRALSAVFCWGQAQCNALKAQYPDCSSNFIVSGNPRAELWANKNYGLYDKMVAEISRQYGDYVLFASTFPVFSPFKKESMVQRFDEFGYVANEEERRAFEDSQARLTRMRDAFAEAIAEIVKAFPSITLVIRPHPSEDADFWHGKFRNNKKVVVTSEYAISPWAMGAKAVLHNSCTTAIEASLYGAPAIAYLPNGEAHGYEVNLSNLVSHQATVLSDVVSLIGGALDGKLEPRPEPVELSEYLRAPSGTCSELAKQLVSGDASARRLAPKKNTSLLVKGWLNWLRLMWDRVGIIRAPDELKYKYGKFPYTHTAEVRAVMSAVFESRSSHVEFDVEKIDVNLFYLKPR